MADHKLADEEVYELIAKKVRTEEEANRINQATLTSLRLQNRLNNDTIQRYAHLSEKVEDMLLVLESRQSISQQFTTDLQHTHDSIRELLKEIRAFSSVLHEVLDELSRRQDRFENRISQRLGRLEDLGLMQLSGQKLTKAQADTASAELQHERTQRELEQHYINLADYRLDAARHGMDVPAHLRNAIRDTEEIISRLETGLGE